MRVIVKVKRSQGDKPSTTAHYIAASKIDREREGAGPRNLFGGNGRELIEYLTYRRANSFLARRKGGTPTQNDIIHFSVSFRNNDFEALGATVDERKRRMREVAAAAMVEIEDELQKTHYVLKKLRLESQKKIQVKGSSGRRGRGKRRTRREGSGKQENAQNKELKLRWVAGIHLNTDNPHLHIILHKEVLNQHDEVILDKNGDPYRIGSIPKSMLNFTPRGGEDPFPKSRNKKSRNGNDGPAIVGSIGEFFLAALDRAQKQARETEFERELVQVAGEIHEPSLEIDNGPSTAPVADVAREEAAKGTDIKTVDHGYTTAEGGDEEVYIGPAVHGYGPDQSAIESLSRLEVDDKHKAISEEIARNLPFGQLNERGEFYDDLERLMDISESRDLTNDQVTRGYGDFEIESVFGLLSQEREEQDMDQIRLVSFLMPCKKPIVDIYDIEYDRLETAYFASQTGNEAIRRKIASAARGKAGQTLQALVPDYKKTRPETWSHEEIINKLLRHQFQGPNSYAEELEARWDEVIKDGIEGTVIGEILTKIREENRQRLDTRIDPSQSMRDEDRDLISFSTPYSEPFDDGMGNVIKTPTHAYVMSMTADRDLRKQIAAAAPHEARQIAKRLQDDPALEQKRRDNWEVRIRPKALEFALQLKFNDDSYRGKLEETGDRPIYDGITNSNTIGKRIMKIREENRGRPATPLPPSDTKTSMMVVEVIPSTDNGVINKIIEAGQQRPDKGTLISNHGHDNELSFYIANRYLARWAGNLTNKNLHQFTVQFRREDVLALGASDGEREQRLCQVAREAMGGIKKDIFAATRLLKKNTGSDWRWVALIEDNSLRIFVQKEVARPDKKPYQLKTFPNDYFPDPAAGIAGVIREHFHSALISGQSRADESELDRRTELTAKISNDLRALLNERVRSTKPVEFLDRLDRQTKLSVEEEIREINKATDLGEKRAEILAGIDKWVQALPDVPSKSKELIGDYLVYQVDKIYLPRLSERSNQSLEGRELVEEIISRETADPNDLRVALKDSTVAQDGHLPPYERAGQFTTQDLRELYERGAQFINGRVLVIPAGPEELNPDKDDTYRVTSITHVVNKFTEDLLDTVKEESRLKLEKLAVEFHNIASNIVPDDASNRDKEPIFSHYLDQTGYGSKGSLHRHDEGYAEKRIEAIERVIGDMREVSKDMAECDTRYSVELAMKSPIVDISYGENFFKDQLRDIEELISSGKYLLSGSSVINSVGEKVLDISHVAGYPLAPPDYKYLGEGHYHNNPYLQRSAHGMALGFRELAERIARGSSGGGEVGSQEDIQDPHDPGIPQLIRIFGYYYSRIEKNAEGNKIQSDDLISRVEAINRTFNEMREAAERGVPPVILETPIPEYDLPPVTMVTFDSVEERLGYAPREDVSIRDVMDAPAIKEYKGQANEFIEADDHEQLFDQSDLPDYEDVELDDIVEYEFEDDRTYVESTAEKAAGGSYNQSINIYLGKELRFPPGLSDKTIESLVKVELPEIDRRLENGDPLYTKREVREGKIHVEPGIISDINRDPEPEEVLRRTARFVGWSGDRAVLSNLSQEEKTEAQNVLYQLGRNEKERLVRQRDQTHRMVENGDKSISEPMLRIRLDRIDKRLERVSKLVKENQPSQELGRQVDEKDSRLYVSLSGQDLQPLVDDQNRLRTDIAIIEKDKAVAMTQLSGDGIEYRWESERWIEAPAPVDKLRPEVAGYDLRIGELNGRIEKIKRQKEDSLRLPVTNIRVLAAIQYQTEKVGLELYKWNGKYGQGVIQGASEEQFNQREDIRNFLRQYTWRRYENPLTRNLHDNEFFRSAHESIAQARTAEELDTVLRDLRIKDSGRRENYNKDSDSRQYPPLNRNQRALLYYSRYENPDYLSFPRWWNKTNPGVRPPQEPEKINWRPPKNEDSLRAPFSNIDRAIRDNILYNRINETNKASRLAVEGMTKKDRLEALIDRKLPPSPALRQLLARVTECNSAGSVGYVQACMKNGPDPRDVRALAAVSPGEREKLLSAWDKSRELYASGQMKSAPDLLDLRELRTLPSREMAKIKAEWRERQMLYDSGHGLPNHENDYFYKITQDKSSLKESFSRLEAAGKILTRVARCASEEQIRHLQAWMKNAPDVRDLQELTKLSPDKQEKIIEEWKHSRALHESGQMKSAPDLLNLKEVQSLYPEARIYLVVEWKERQTLYDSAQMLLSHKNETIHRLLQDNGDEKLKQGLSKAVEVEREEMRKRIAEIKKEMSSILRSATPKGIVRQSISEHRSLQTEVAPGKDADPSIPGQAKLNGHIINGAVRNGNSTSDWIVKYSNLDEKRQLWMKEKEPLIRLIIEESKQFIKDSRQFNKNIEIGFKELITHLHVDQNKIQQEGRQNRGLLDAMKSYAAALVAEPNVSLDKLIQSQRSTDLQNQTNDKRTVSEAGRAHLHNSTDRYDHFSDLSRPNLNGTHEIVDKSPEQHTTPANERQMGITPDPMRLTGLLENVPFEAQEDVIAHELHTRESSPEVEPVGRGR
jgi:hypothetical protein